MTRARRSLLLASLLLLAALALPMTAGARQNSPPPLRVAINGFENNLTPFSVTFASAPNTNDLVALVYDSLFWSQAKEQPEPWLAQSAQPNADFTEWTVTLRDGIRWQDGKPLTADDVKFSLDYYKQQAGASGRYAHHVSDTPPFRSAQVVDDRTVRLSYSAPAPQFMVMPGADLPILPKHIWEGVTDPKTMSTGLPVGSGPYKLVKIVPDQLYRFEANADYFKGKPTVDVLELPVVKDPSAAFGALRTGEVSSVAVNVPGELFDQFSRNPDVALAKSTRFQSTQVNFNARKAPLTDARLRKAISMATDRRALVDTVLLGHGVPGVATYLDPASPWAVANAQPDYDPAAAAAMLDAAGYRAGAGGIRVAPNGTPLTFSLLVNSFAPQDVRAGQLLAQQLAPLGVELKVEALDPATLQQRRQAKVQGDPPPYDAYVATLESHGHVDPDALYYFFHSPGPKGFGAGITGYSNPKFDALAEAATTAPNAERKALDARLQQILATDVPSMALWYRDGDWAYRPAAYDGWVADPGQGILTKRSFLPEYVAQARASRQSGSGAVPAADRSASAGAGSSTVLLGVAAGVLVVIVAAVVIRRRRVVDDEDEDD
jgi:peptide/nickel transport system substrate-binding protein